MKHSLKINDSFLILSSLFFSLSTAHAEAVLRQVSVSGSCTRMVVPDRASIMVTAEIMDSDPKKAMNRATEIYEKVRSNVLKLKIENKELSTSEVSLNERKEWESNKLVSKGFVARMGLRVESSDAASLGEVSQIAAKAGVKEIGGLNTFISSVKNRAETEACLKDAVKTAEKKAREMAEASGAKLGEVISLTEQSSGGIVVAPPTYAAKGLMMMDASADRSAAPTIEPGKQEIQATVSASYYLK